MTITMCFKIKELVTPTVICNYLPLVTSLPKFLITNAISDGPLYFALTSNLRLVVTECTKSLKKVGLRKFQDDERI